MLNVPNRVVYLPHDYPELGMGATVVPGRQLRCGSPAKFRSEWGYIHEQNIATDLDRRIRDQAGRPEGCGVVRGHHLYLSGDFDNNGTIDIPAGTEDMSWAYWSWNPNSGDTGGILADDWRTINQNKLVYLKPIMYSGGNGTSVATFTVTLAAPSSQTGDGAVHDLQRDCDIGKRLLASVGTLTFLPGETLKTIRWWSTTTPRPKATRPSTSCCPTRWGDTDGRDGWGTIIDRASA